MEKFYLSVVLAILAILPAVAQDAVQETVDVWSSGCLGNRHGAPLKEGGKSHEATYDSIDEIPMEEFGSIIFTYQNEVLSIEFVAWEFDCGGMHFSPEAAVDNGIISIDMNYEENGIDCMCIYSFGFSIPGVPAGSYDLSVWGLVVHLDLEEGLKKQVLEEELYTSGIAGNISEDALIVDEKDIIFKGEGKLCMEVYSSNGALVASSGANRECSLSMHSLSRGIYLVKASSSNGELSRKIFVK